MDNAVLAPGRPQSLLATQLNELRIQVSRCETLGGRLRVFRQKVDGTDNQISEAPSAVPPAEPTQHSGLNGAVEALIRDLVRLNNDLGDEIDRIDSLV